MISSKTFTGDGSTKAFPIDFEILGEDYVQIWLDNIAVTDRTHYDIINNSIVFLDDYIPASGVVITIAVATTAQEIADLNAPPSGVVTVSDNIDNVNTVAGSIANVNTVADDITNVNNVGGSIATVNTVAANNDNITKVANIDAEVTTTANNDTNITTVATNITDVNIVATNVADIHNFADVYQKPKADDPTLRNDGSALQKGDLYFNTTDNVLKNYNGSLWLTIQQYSDLDILNKVKNVDGSGSGLDADLLDGKEASEFALLNGDNTQAFKVADAVNADEAITKAQHDLKLDIADKRVCTAWLNASRDGTIIASEGISSVVTNTNYSDWTITVDSSIDLSKATVVVGGADGEGGYLASLGIYSYNSPTGSFNIRSRSSSDGNINIVDTSILSLVVFGGK